MNSHSQWTVGRVYSGQKVRVEGHGAADGPLAWFLRAPDETSLTTGPETFAVLTCRRV